MADFTEEGFADLALSHATNRCILDRLRMLGLRQAHLVAGCLFQVVWNRRAGLAPEHGIKDYDVFYFDDRDLSFEAEDAVIAKVRAATADLGVALDIKNQARVHLWYAARFGQPYPQLTSTTDGIDRFLIACTCIGIDAATGALHAPDGITDLWNGVLRVNPRQPEPKGFLLKAQSYRQRWPWLTIVAPQT